MSVCEIIFWTCMIVVFYTYIGYGILLYVAVLIKRIAVGRRPCGAGQPGQLTRGGRGVWALK